MSRQAPDYSGASKSAARVSETPATETSAPATAADPVTAQNPAVLQAYERGKQAKAQGVQRRAVPGEYRECVGERIVRRVGQGLGRDAIVRKRRGASTVPRRLGAGPDQCSGWRRVRSTPWGKER